jgi:MtaA/CmuA family methyltransferase
MNSLERTVRFIEGKETDRVPFHPILMRFAARHAGVRYKDFCLSPEHKCSANILCARDFQSDWVNTMSDPYAEAEAYGTILHYPDDDLPKVRKYAVTDISDTDALKVLRVDDHNRLAARTAEIREYVKRTSDRVIICGWVEGPLAEYCDIRDINQALTDLYEYPDVVQRALDIMTESAIGFITAQVSAGAHCIGIGDSVCSLISPDLYNEFCLERQKALVDHIHSLGAYAKIHICGNISAILPAVISTGANIIDIDHRTGSVSDAVKLLSNRQVFAGKSDPVSILQDGGEDKIRESSILFFREAAGRAILSAGCEVTPGTDEDQLKYFGSLSGMLLKER